MSWKWLEKTDTLFRKLEALGWDHLHLAPCWEHGPNIYRLAGSQYLPPAFGDRRQRFEVVGDVRELLQMGKQLDDEFRAAVTSRQ